MPARGVQDQHAARPREPSETLQALGDQRHLGGVARLRAHVQRHPVGTRGLQRPDLASDALPLSPPVLNQRRVLIRAAHSQRGQIDMQAAGVDPEALDRAGGERATQRLGVHREDLQRPPETVVVQQGGGDPEQLLQRRARRPPSDVIQRRGRAQPAAAQRRDRLPDRQLLAPALRQRAIDRPDQIKLRDEVPRQQQRPDVPAHARQRRVQPRERAHQLLQLARRLELVLPPQRLQHAMTNAPLLVAIRLHQPQIHVALASPTHSVTLDIHVGPTIPDLSDGTDAAKQAITHEPDRNTSARLALHNEHAKRHNHHHHTHDASKHPATRPTRAASNGSLIESPRGKRG